MLQICSRGALPDALAHLLIHYVIKKLEAVRRPFVREGNVLKTMKSHRVLEVCNNPILVNMYACTATIDSVHVVKCNSDV